MQNVDLEANLVLYLCFEDIGIIDKITKGRRLSN